MRNHGDKDVPSPIEICGSLARDIATQGRMHSGCWASTVGVASRERPNKANKNMPKEKSHCCDAERKPRISDDGTGYFICSKCGDEFLTLDDKYHISESLRLGSEEGD